MFCVLTLLLSGDVTAAPPKAVVVLGGTMAEREQEYGHWEAAARLTSPRPLRVRNLAWSGDTVWGSSRGRFDPPADGYRRMIDDVTALDPDLLVFGYGNAEALQIATGTEPTSEATTAFATQYRTLVADLPDSPRLFLGPSATMLTRLPEDVAASRLAVLRSVEAAIEEIADENGATFLSLLDVDGNRNWTDDGIQWNAAGYEATATRVGQAIAAVDDGHDLPQGSPDRDRLDALRSAIRHKNRLVFHRHRPQNTTYLLLFRKHEQGQNAGEIAAFEPSIRDAEAVIDAMIASLR